MHLLLFAIGAVLFHLSCGAAPREVPLLVSDRATAMDGRQVDDYAKAADAIVGVLARKLQLPVPRYTMEIYSVPAEFEAALIANLKLKPETARTTATFARAAVGNRRVMVNETAMAARSWPERMVDLAHEIAHTSQLELAGQRSLVRYQWLVEGFAEWVAYRVVHELGVEDFATSRASMVTRVREARSAVGLAPLAALDSLEQWIDERKQRGFDAMYPYAFLVLDFLVERHSYDSAIDFFRRRRGSADAAANFRAAFGESLPEFQAALDNHMAKFLQ